MTKQVIDWKAPRLVGKRFVFAGTARWIWRGAAELAKAEGAEVLPQVTADVDFLVVESYPGSRATGAEKKAEALIRKGAAIQVLDIAGFCQLFLPSREEALAMLTAGEEGLRRWSRLAGQHWIKGQVDLRGVNLRGAQLEWTTFQAAVLDGADLRDIKLNSLGCLWNIEGVRLDNAHLAHATVNGVKNCSLKNVDLSDGRIYDAENSNLDVARLVKTHLNNVFRCQVRRADLTEARVSGSLEGSDLSGSCLFKAKASHSKGTGAIFRTANLRETNFEHGCFPQADFSGADMSQAIFEQSDLTGAKFVKAKLVQVDLTRANLTDADLTKADLRRANLANADLSKAIIAGANFEGANLTGTVLTGLTLAEARGLDSTVRGGGALGPRLQELEDVAKQTRRLEIQAVVDLDNKSLELRFDSIVDYSYRASVWVQGQHQWGYPQTLSDAMLFVARKWAMGKLQFDALKVKSSKCPLDPRRLRKLVLDAWCEAFGEEVPSDESLRSQKAARQTSEEETRARFLAELRSGAEGVERWNARTPQERKKGGRFREADLSGAALAGVDLQWLDFQGANFTGATLTSAQLKRVRFIEANLENASLEGAAVEQGNFRRANFRGANLKKAYGYGVRFHDADFEGASLANANLRWCNFRGANLRQADLREASLSDSDLRQADLSSADLTGAYFDDARYDEATKFPKGFRIPPTMKWVGAGPLPGTKAKTNQAGNLVDFEDFLKRLQAQVDPARLSKALAMLKAERFQFYAQVDADALVGVVKSQRDVNLVYSCRLAADGSFACCTQNMNLCGGPRGAVCKHLLVLIVGLTKAGQLNPAWAEAWARASLYHHPKLDHDEMAEAFLQYKGAEAGEIDWRPTETIPEDYYTL
jgi:uncharacterized protein YjbI with pentapeptide repeats